MSTKRQTRDPREIEVELDRNRARLGETLDTLQNKLSPGGLFDQVFNYVRAKGGGNEFASSFKQTVARNPLPVALVGLGLAWLAVAGRRDSGPGDYSSQMQGYEQDPHDALPSDLQPDALDASSKSVSGNEKVISDETSAARDKAGANASGGVSSISDSSDEVTVTRAHTSPTGGGAEITSRPGNLDVSGPSNKVAEAADEANATSNQAGRTTFVRHT